MVVAFLSFRILSFILFLSVKSPLDLLEYLVEEIKSSLGIVQKHLDKIILGACIGLHAFFQSRYFDFGGRIVTMF